MTRRKKDLVAVLLPPVLALHAYLIWRGGAWRIFALVEAGVGIMLALVMRDLKKMEMPAANSSANETTRAQRAQNGS